jgi:Type II CAAX prenyl endopeptidase Rce1-like
VSRVHEANRHSHGGHLLSACAGYSRGGGLIDQDPRSHSDLGYVDLVVVHSYCGGFGYAASLYPGGLRQGGLEGAGPPPSGPERLVGRPRGGPAHNRGRLSHRVATPLASFVVPQSGIVDTFIQFLIRVILFTLTFALLEEIGIRGYLLPKLLSLGRTRALALSGLVFATWHVPLILLTPVFPVGNKLISLPLFYGTVVVASFVYGYLRLYTGSVWPASSPMRCTTPPRLPWERSP